MCDFPTILRNSEAVQSLRIFRSPFRSLDNLITRSIGTPACSTTEQAGFFFVSFAVLSAAFFFVYFVG